MDGLGCPGSPPRGVHPQTRCRFSESISDFARHYFRNLDHLCIFTSVTPMTRHSYIEELNVEPGRHLANLRLAFLPSSLTKTLPFALGYSPCSPVSVCGTDTHIRTLEAFLDTPLPPLFSHCWENRNAPSDYIWGICLPNVLRAPTPIQ